MHRGAVCSGRGAAAAATGRQRLAADCVQLELAVALLCDRLSNLGTAYRVLCAFKPLLFQTPEQVAKSLGKVLPHSLALHVLFARGPLVVEPVLHLGWTSTQPSTSGCSCSPARWTPTCRRCAPRAAPALRRCVPGDAAAAEAGHRRTGRCLSD